MLKGPSSVDFGRSNFEAFSEKNCNLENRVSDCTYCLLLSRPAWQPECSSQPGSNSRVQPPGAAFEATLRRLWQRNLFQTHFGRRRRRKWQDQQFWPSQETHQNCCARQVTQRLAEKGLQENRRQKKGVLGRLSHNTRPENSQERSRFETVSSDTC